MLVLCYRYPLQDRPGVSVALKNRAQGSICVGIEFINYAQAKQLEVTKGQVSPQAKWYSILYPGKLGQSQLSHLHSVQLTVCPALVFGPKSGALQEHMLLLLLKFGGSVSQGRWRDRREMHAWGRCH